MKVADISSKITRGEYRPSSLATDEKFRDDCCLMLKQFPGLDAAWGRTMVTRALVARSNYRTALDALIETCWIGYAIDIDPMPARRSDHGTKARR